VKGARGPAHRVRLAGLSLIHPMPGTDEVKTLPYAARGAGKAVGGPLRLDFTGPGDPMTNQPPAAPPPAPVRKDKFGLHCVHWIAIVPVLAFVAAVVALLRDAAHADPSVEGSRVSGTVMGMLLWGIFLAFCVACVAWHVTGRSRFFSTVAFIAVIVILTRNTTQRLTALTGPRTAEAQTVHPHDSRGGLPGGSPASAAASPEAALNAARDRAAGRLIANQDKAKALMNRWLDAGGADLGQPGSTEELERRLAMLEGMIAACRQLNASDDLALAAYGRELGAGLPEHERERVLADVRAAAADPEGNRRLHACERVMVADQELFGFLRAQWGKWTRESETGECRFEDEASGEHYERLIADAKYARGQLEQLVQSRQLPDAAE
jgi:hypothetical protein